MAKLPEIDRMSNITSNFIGFVNELPKDGTVGQVVLEAGSSIPYVFNGTSWIELGSLTSTKTIKEELLEVLNRYPGSAIAKDVKNLLELYEKRMYA